MTEHDPFAATHKFDGNLYAESDEPTQVVAADVRHLEPPKQIGRYRIERFLGKGGFGVVYLAYDPLLDRLVAVKIPHTRRISRPEDTHAYLTEARTVANLDHPHIVPVYDVGSSAEFPCYVVSRFIEGTNLSRKVNEGLLTFIDVSQLIATIAEALHYAHKQGIVHRDVKPGNILIARDNTPYLVDFGLALREENFGKSPTFAGTPAYCSPEQARGEGHRVDGRSDIYSIGAVFYECLTGRRTFQGKSESDILDQVASLEPKPPRQINDVIPAELERICLKALSKSVSERYTTALDLTNDLRHFLAEKHHGAIGGPSGTPTSIILSSDSTTVFAESSTFRRDSRPLRIVPKGLRSFDEHDADFFLELLPGPRDRDHLPERIRFWKTRIEEIDADRTFPVGLIYGPSGCGKSSLVKAGLLPRLSERVICLYLETTPAGTERHLLTQIQKHCRGIAEEIRLRDALAALRRGEFLNEGDKVLIILDQFEQWLHDKTEVDNTELVQALRQCDGGRVQCLLMVRDDFWLAISRFMRELEVRLVEGHNIALADLFDVDHARKVLLAFGQAFGRLPQNLTEASRDQKDFIKQSIEALAENGKVSCVRLALFAEMMKGKSWTTATLKEVGGIEGVGATFLEETFSSSTASPQHRYHENAARSVLGALLPDIGTDIKGQMKSYEELLLASGYAGQPNEFDDLVAILDNEIRLITPTDRDGMGSGREVNSQTSTGQKYYQLSHDYLVNSLREWLTRKQKETRRGRAELTLQERTSFWSVRSEPKQLPSFFEWVDIQRHTRRSAWSACNAGMMRAASRVYLRRMFTVLGVFVLILSSFFYVRHIVDERQNAEKFKNLISDLWQARTEHVPEILNALDQNPETWTPAARLVADSDESPVAQRARAYLALSANSNDYLPQLAARLLECDDVESGLILQRVSRWKREIARHIWVRIVDGELDPEQRIRAAAALIHTSDFDSDEWADIGKETTDALVSRDPLFVNAWVDELIPMRHAMRSRLVEISLASTVPIDRRLTAVSVIRYFSQQDVSYLDARSLLELALSSNASIRSATDGILLRRQSEVLPMILEVASAQFEPGASAESELAVKHAATAILVAQRLEQDRLFWEQLSELIDPRVRTELINRIDEAKLAWGDFQTHLRHQPAAARQAIVLGLAENLSHFSDSEIEQIRAAFVDLFHDDPDSGVHSAAEYALHMTGRGDELPGMRLELANKPAPARNWQILSNGLCMISVERPGLIRLGSSDSQMEMGFLRPNREVEISYPFEISATEISVRQFREFHADAQPAHLVTPSEDCPMSRMDLFSAMRFCRWLSEQQPEFDETNCCYPPVDQIGMNMRLPDDYLRRSGFRLPTIYEWEYSVRAGSTTGRFFGDSVEQLNRYCWWVGSSQQRLWPVGLKRPNAWGLFDVHGNVLEWCHEAEIAFDPAGQPVRGGDYRSTERFLRSSFAEYAKSANTLSTIGFRVVRIR